MRRKMSIEDRAKQFLPFAALKGHQEALKIKEEEVEEQLHIMNQYGDGTSTKIHKM